MDSITKLIKNEILNQYGSVKKFSDISGIPYSTLSNALSKGINGTSYGTVNKICKILNIKQIYDGDLTMFNEKFHEICKMLESIDEQGIHTVQAVLTLEYNRCKKTNSKASVKSYNGIAFASNAEEDYE